ncbi:hypothetical protein LVJ83_05010 [Uruburuella testudinis]|uniref:Uncharacterized protein n=1 Tax=Uruburuella testudinis TaxID=1282863 RepID=A0ABY4DXM1_9NEIS|nr:hypothetical protein [Uruburuella testudinis]UOO82824.1 hypothetical protein LVJ83_05010 [Uruburuella testudinis]
MSTQQNFYDVYVSYPPGIDRTRIDACIRDNLPQQEAEDLIQALRDHPQAIIAERCTHAERENAQHYFNYLGLDVITRRSLELAPVIDTEQEKPALPEPVPQCPVCYTIIEDPESKECPICHLHFDSSSEALIQRKRIEWQEKVAFEHRKQHEIAHKLLKEKQEEEKRLRKKIREKLEQELREEIGARSAWQTWFHGSNALVSLMIILILIVILVFIGYLLAQFFG